MERRLAAILAADVVGYSRLMAADEAGTLARFKALRAAIIDPKLAQFHGSLVGSAGDSLLVEFPSVVDAVQCAVEMQKRIAEHNGDEPEDRQIIFRMGVNLGDVIADGGTIHGDGVNIAARLEKLSEPGSVVVARTVHEQILGKLAYATTDLGPQRVKNIAEPVHAFRVAIEPSSASKRGPGLAPPAKPSVVVLPFTNMSGDPEQEYFADGITEDIITELSRFRSLFVIARNSSFTFKGQSVDIKAVAETLGVHYVVEGSVRRAGSRIRVTAQLLEAATGNHVWAERYDRVLEDIFEVQDEVTQNVVTAIVGRLESAARRRIGRISIDDFEAFDCLLRGKALFNRFSRTEADKARDLFARAITLDPTNAQAHAYLGVVHLLIWLSHWTLDGDSEIDAALRFGKRAIELDDSDSRCHGCLGETYNYLREFDSAHFHLHKAIDLNPNDSEMRCLFGLLLAHTGEYDEAFSQFAIARRTDPFDLSWILWLEGFANFCAHRYADSVSLLTRIESPHLEIPAILAASYAYMGEDATARSCMEQFLQRAETEMADFPGRDPEAWRRTWRSLQGFRDEADIDHWIDGLRRAGLEG